MNVKPIIIDNITIHLPNGWQGDSILLARLISSQIQKHALDLTGCDEFSLSIRGQFAGNVNNLIPQLSKQLTQQGNNKFNGDQND